MTSFNSDKKERIYDVAKNDSRITISYIVVNNDSLGGGGFGEVFLVQKENSGEQPENQPLYAMKRIKKDGIINDKDKLHRVLTEIKIHRSLNNPYICKYEHSFEDKNSIYILMEYCEKKSLDDYLKSRKTLSEYETRFYMYQVLKALKYLKRQKVIHRDLTLANVFLKDYKTIKIGDFGLSYKETENEEKQGLMCGTQGYFTPESYTTKYSYKTDIFDFGVCIYHLMTGNTLFKDSVSSYESVRKGEILYDDKTKFSFQAKDLFKKIFVIENQRIDLEKIEQHDFFNQGQGLTNIEFPDYFKMPKKDFEDKIKELEKNVIMTDVSFFPRKNTLNKEENYPSYMTKKSLNESSDINKSREYGLNESMKTNGLASNKRLLDLSKNKFSLNSEISENNENNNNNGILDKKRLRSSINKKKEEESDREGTAKKKGVKKVTLLISDEKMKKDKEEKDKNISESPKPENEVNLREKLEQQNLKMKKIENNSDNKKISVELNTFKLRQSTKSLDMNMNEDFDKEEMLEKISFKEYENEKEEKDDYIYIKEIIEINEKYGIAYRLNNKDIGILFKDSSHITKFKKTKNLIYYVNNGVEKKIILPLKNEKDENLKKKLYYLGYIIEEIKKKKLRNKNHINNEKENETEKNNVSNNISNHNNSIESRMINENLVKKMKKNNVYLVKFKRNNYAYFFILSNKTIQIDFFDETKVIFICSLDKKIIYINKEGNISQFELGLTEDFSNFKCDNLKINKKIKYCIREIKK